MSHKQKIGKNIYYNPLCKKNPFSVNIMRNGRNLTKSFPIQSDAEQARDKFIRDNTFKETEHPNVTEKNGTYHLDVVIHREYSEIDKAIKDAETLLRYAQ